VNPKLQYLFDFLEQDRSKLIAIITPLSSEELKQAPAGKWSIDQVLAHIIAAEKLSIAYIQKKILGIKEAGDTGLWEEIKLVMLQISQRLPLKFKAPKTVVEHTPVYSSLNELVADWDKTRDGLRTLLENFEDSQVKRKIYRHFFAGRLNIQHALVFLREHMAHHRPQINRLLK
jgi:uncharacterized damage-inducible protein DinB